MSTCYIGIVGGEIDYAECRDSIQALQTRPGDEMKFVRATKGYEGRQLHLNAFMESGHEYLFLMDHDQIFPQDALERLRAHNLPYVSGYYLRRRFNPILPVWYEYGESNTFPMRPWTSEPARGQLHRLGASGWGCVLVQRQVVEAVRPLLKGEPEIIEDDMDLWPMDLGNVAGALACLEELAQNENITKPAFYAEFRQLLGALRAEFRPLRGKKDIVGSDLRFPFFAREAGITLYGDPDVRCGHVTHYPLSPDDFSRSVSDEMRSEIDQAIDADQDHERAEIWEARDRLENKNRRAQ
jgi:hypothetical protein